MYFRYCFFFSKFCQNVETGPPEHVKFQWNQKKVIIIVQALKGQNCQFGERRVMRLEWRIEKDKLVFLSLSPSDHPKNINTWSRETKKRSSLLSSSVLRHLREKQQDDMTENGMGKERKKGLGFEGNKKKREIVVSNSNTECTMYCVYIKVYGFVE